MSHFGSGFKFAISTAMLLITLSLASAEVPPDTIFHHGKIVTVDPAFSIQQALAVRGDRIAAVGDDATLLAMAGPNTELVDLHGHTVLPGLIDSHVHATAAAVHEFDHPIPTMRSVADVLDYIAGRAAVVEKGQWIRVSQVFITRLDDQRFPNRYELDRVAPDHPVIFRTGPDAALNSLALRLSGIDRNFVVSPGLPGIVERDPQTGEPTGILRSAQQFVKGETSPAGPSEAQRIEWLKRLLADYNSVGITSISDRNASDGAIRLYESLKRSNELTCRVFLYYGVNASGTLSDIRAQIEKAAASPLHDYDNRLWLRGVKVFLDGGMLTGSAWMQEPWGVSEIYGIHDPDYRGVRNIDPEKLYQISRLALSNDLQMTAHAVGDAATQLLVDTYAQIDQDDFPVREKRPCVTHCNFLSESAIETMARLGIVADLQPAWLWLDGRTLLRQFGQSRMRWFQPYRELKSRGVTIGGGSDHMQKIGSFRSVNPYNPFLGIWITVARQPRGSEQPLHPEESLTRAEAIALYTINNARISFEEHEKGSLEPGKLADLIVLAEDILSCPEDRIKDIEVLQTYVGGQRVFQR